tara:strand:+ start:1568 stop:2749 length:1182 start_codon:yes stop_codon:yes gene_type:complete
MDIILKNKIVGIIPARGKSKRIENKNLIKISGKPLLQYTLEHVNNSKYLKNNTYVSSDSSNILELALKNNVKVISRPPNLSDDTSTSESSLIHALDVLKDKNFFPEIIVFLQCTSPIRSLNDIDDAIDFFLNNKFDSILSVVDSKKFLWNQNKKGANAINYDINNRKREQDINSQFEENGSIYITKNSNLRKYKNRISGKIGLYKMSYWSGFQVDSKDDVTLVSNYLSKNNYNHIQKKIELIVFDFDGVFTNDYLIMDENGKESVVLSRKDGMGIKRLKKEGFKILILSSEKNDVVKKRAEKLGVEVQYNESNKLLFLKNYISQNKINKSNVMFVGNDINDEECMGFVGIPIAVSDAIPKVREKASIILMNKGGKEVIREVSDLILNKYDKNE